MKAFWTTAELRALGRSEREIRRAVERGLLLVARRGHLALADTDPRLVQAVRIGGVPSGAAAARLRGLWTPPDPRLEEPREPRAPTPPGARLVVAVPRNAPRLHDPHDPARAFRRNDDVVLCWTDPVEVAAGSAMGLASPLLMLEHVWKDLPAAWALGVTDSALKHRWIRQDDLAALASRLPVHLHAAVGASTGRADSGIERVARFRFRFRLRLLGLDVVVLVGLDGIGTVDLLVDGWLVIELDGREFHEGDRFERDRARDLAATVQRYRTLRFSRRQVIFRWPEVERAVLAALATR